MSDTDFTYIFKEFTRNKNPKNKNTPDWVKKFLNDLKDILVDIKKKTECIGKLTWKMFENFDKLAKSSPNLHIFSGGSFKTFIDSLQNRFFLEQRNLFVKLHRLNKPILDLKTISHEEVVKCMGYDMFDELEKDFGSET